QSATEKVFVEKDVQKEIVEDCISMANAGYIGIDVGGTKTRLSLLDANFKVLEAIGLKTLSSPNAETFTRTLKESLSILMDRGRTRRLEILNPEVIVLGGGLADKMPALIRTEVEAGIRRNSKREPIRALNVVTAKLKGHAVATGAAFLQTLHSR